MGSNPAPGFKARPDHRITLGDGTARVRLTHRGAVIADTKNAIILNEASYPPRYYIPQADVAMDRMAGTDRKTHCPFKGDARYWSLTVDGETLDNVAWAYDQPFDEMAALAGHIAFDTDRVDLIDA
ncbi:MAG: DUF427 domain-containing protein [Alphaproteobacteria bacterium]